VLSPACQDEHGAAGENDSIALDGVELIGNASAPCTFCSTSRTMAPAPNCRAAVVFYEITYAGNRENILNNREFFCLTGHFMLSCCQDISTPFHSGIVINANLFRVFV
jgi:hypothetical protein